MKFSATTGVHAYLNATNVMDFAIAHMALMNQKNYALQIGFNPKVHTILRNYTEKINMLSMLIVIVL